MSRPGILFGIVKDSSYVYKKANPSAQFMSQFGGKVEIEEEKQGEFNELSTGAELKDMDEEYYKDGD